MATTDSLFEELQQRGYQCEKGNSLEGSVCFIQAGPNGRFDPVIAVHQRDPRLRDNGGFHWEIGGRKRRATLEIDTGTLAELVIASIEEPSW